MWNYVAIFWGAISLITFGIFGIDKWKARNNRWRIPESTLFLLSIFGGSIGALLGMQVWHHKTQHWSFRLGIPLIIILQATLILWIIFGIQD